jgi:hypothetical protein
MDMRKVLGFLFGLIVSLWLGVSLALAQSGYPQPTVTTINDFAHLLNANDTAAITQLLTDLKNKHGIEGTVVVLVGYHILAYIFGWPVGNSRSDNNDDHSSWSSHSSRSSSSSSSSESSFGGGASGSW